MMRVFTLLAIVATLPSCKDVQCGEGTFASGDECIGHDPNDHTAPVVTVTPLGGRSRAPLPAFVTLETDELARIVYTTDGSDPDPASASAERNPVTVIDISQGTTVKFLAIDAAGNASAIETATYESDVIAPPSVTGMTVTVAGTAAMVTWTNPSGGDYAGTVLARVADVVDVSPPVGMMVSGPMMLSPSVQVLAVGTGGSFVDPDRPAGPVRYVAWTYDDLGNYSRPAAASSEIALGALTAKLTYVVDTNTLTVTQAPANLSLAGSMPMLSGTNLTINLSVTNLSAKFFQNPKVEVTAVTNAAFANSNGIADTFPFRTLGPNMLAPTATVVRDLAFTGAAAGTTITIDLTFAHHPSLLWTYRYGEQNFVDLGSSALITPALTLTARGPNDRVRGRIKQPVFIGGRYLDLPTSHGVVERFDLVTRTSVQKGFISFSEKAVLQSLIPTGPEMIGIVKKAGRRDSGAVEIVRLDESLKVTGRVETPFVDDQGFSRPALSPDGSTIAAPVSGGIMMIDIATLSVIDAVPLTPQPDLVATDLMGSIRSITFFNNGNGMLVLGRRLGEIAILKKSGATWTKTRVVDPTPNTKVFGAQTMPDGKIWIAMSPGLRVFDPANDSITPLPGYPNPPAGVALIEGQIWVMRQDRLNIDQVNATGAVQRTITVPALNGFYGHWLSVAK